MMRARLMHRKPVRQHDQALDAVAGRDREGPLQVIRMPDRHELGGYAESPRRGRRLFDLCCGRRFLRIVEDADPTAFGERAAQQLEALSRQVRRHIREAREVSARAREARDHALSLGVAAERDDDRDRGRRLFRRPDRRPQGDDQVDLGGDELGGELRQAIQDTVRVPLDQGEISSLDTPELAQRREELRDADIVSGGVVENANGWRPSLRLSRQEGR